MTHAQHNEFHTQLMAIGQINAALHAATACGLFDEMAASVSHPDVINTFCDDMARLTASRMHPFDVTAAGNDSGSDETGDRAFCVKAPNAEAVQAAIAGTGANFYPHTGAPTGIDFHLPFEHDKLRSAVLQFNKPQPSESRANASDPLANHPKFFLEALGYKIDDDSQAEGMWFWFTDANGGDNFASASDALEGAWKDAVSLTRDSRNIALEQWEALSFAQQKIAITQVLSPGESVKDGETQRLEPRAQAVDVNPTLPALARHPKIFLEALGYTVDAYSEARGMWFWFTPRNGDGTFSSPSDALEGAWKDAAGFTMGIRNIASEQWDALSFEQQKTEITEALSQGKSVMATA